MHLTLTYLTIVALAVAGGISAEPLSQARHLGGISQQQFHDNCNLAGGRYGALSGQVLCLLSPRIEVVCQFAETLGNCLWTGPIQSGSLMAILGHRPGAPKSAISRFDVGADGV